MPETTQNLNIKQAFYDIESLNNVFSLCNFKYNDNVIHVYLRVDDRLDTPGADGQFLLTDYEKRIISERIYEKNKNFNGNIVFHDLAYYNENLHLINEFGAKDDAGSFEKLAAEESAFNMFINDVDPDYSDNKDYYLMGYNSFNYDTTMIALYVNETFWIANGTLRFNPPSAQTMRNHNDMLFTPAFKERMPSYLQRPNNSGKSGFANRENILRTNMIRSGRYIDVALLNEKMQKVGLKRILGMLGYQILESDKLDNENATLTTLDELADLIAYNVSDVVNLRMLLMHNTYRSNFELKKTLLKTYPELIYDKKKDSYAPDIAPDKVRKDRLYIDSSSSKLAARSLCPYGILNDIETVSFMYPHEEKAKEFGIPRVNVLDECRKFFYKLYPTRPDLQAEFDRIYFYYKNNIEGHNFNESNEYAEYWKTRREDKTPLPAHSVSEIEKSNLTLPYYDANGDPSKCYVVFGIGGIHGAEYNKALYDADVAAYQQIKNRFDAVKRLYPDPLMLKQKTPGKKKAWSFEYEGVTYKASDFLKAGATAVKAEWKDISKKEPELFRPEKGGYKLNKRYAYTSIADSNHEDFTSYYPNLLIMLMAFWNDGLGYDRYAEIFDNKQKYGKLMKTKGLSEAEIEHYDTLRNGTKLILNSASGGADAPYFTPIRMHNQILSMRIIGQLFTWRIGQAQTYAGADIISTNTDGLYSVFEATENAQILAREAADIHVGIEPEYCKLVSKDSNNRLELDEKGKIISASGGSLACYKRPDPTKSLAHAAIIDYALCEYLRNADHIHANDSFISQPFDYDKGRVILYNSQFSFPDKVKYLLMFQTIVASSIGTQAYIFGETDNFQGYKANVCEIPFNQGLFDAACTSLDVNIMSHYNRIFFVKKEFHTVYGKPTYHLSKATARVVTAAQKHTRQKNNQIPIQHDPYALAILDKFGLHESDIPVGKEAKITKVSGIGVDWDIYIENRSLFELSDEEKQLLINNLDMEKYLLLLGESFDKNWSNAASCAEESDDDDEA